MYGKNKYTYSKGSSSSTTLLKDEFKKYETEKGLIKEAGFVKLGKVLDIDIYDDVYYNVVIKVLYHIFLL